MKNYQKLKQIIQEAQPDRNWRIWTLIPNSDDECGWREEPIRLADVLLAMREEHKKQNKKNTIINRYKVAFIILKVINYWNLKDDSLDNQSDETKKFLIKLLVK